ncbi:MAG: nucleotidyltransferase domain-containing protein [Candidatus Woesearchaeota archaeon]|nr:nucleotidyltransferase domain-containing protein [Nanoarchaeota archaeon]MBU1622098.1 nucleotidyltransferase domain-containing protein [Nanoarchaeota archaeon]
MFQKNRHMSKKLDIVSVFLRDYSASYSGREIARKIRVSPQTGLSILNILVKEKVLNVQKEGRNNKYSLNRKDLISKLMLSLAEINKARDFLEKNEMKLILSKLLPLTETIIVFGSFAKNIEKKSSDLDLIVIGVKNQNKFRKVKNIFPREINVEFISWSGFVKTMKTALGIEIRKDHLIYGNVFKVVEVYSQK